jgi:hypothetical protein
MLARSARAPRENGGMKRSASVAIAAASGTLVVAGIVATVALALLPAQSSGPVSDVASIVISPKAGSTATPVPTSDPTTGASGPAVPVAPAAPTVVEPEPEHGGNGGDDKGGNSGKDG